MDREYTKLKSVKRINSALKRETKEGWVIPSELVTLGDLVHYLSQIQDISVKWTQKILPKVPSSLLMKVTKALNEISLVRIDGRDAIFRIASEKGTFYDVLTPAGLDRLVAKVKID